MQEHRCWVMHEKQEVDVNRELREVLEKERVRSH